MTDVYVVIDIEIEIEEQTNDPSQFCSDHEFDSPERSSVCCKFRNVFEGAVIQRDSE